MRQTFDVRLIVDAGENSPASLIEAVCQELERRGFGVTRPHSLDDIAIVEIKEVIPPVEY